ncbi:Calx-beta domain-containing protein [Pseudoduganella danionis]|uniref:Calx-beta domain-containing protein n=1 Tax=Pseudoduganella danionis TaxID=1890295 RepID=UPI0035AEB1A5
MTISNVSVSFANGFIGDYSRNNEASNSTLLSTLGWSNLQFVQASDNGQFGGTQGNDYSGTILVTDANNVQHAIDGVINWRAPSGSVSTIVFYATGNSHTLATSSGTYVVDPFTQANNDPHSFIGLTFNGMTLSISGGSVTGNAATSGLLSALNTYLASQPQITIGDVTVNENAGTATVTVSLSRVSTDTVTVDYSTSNGSATAGTDYSAATGSLTFAPGQTSKTFQVSITDNALTDGNRNFSVQLSNSALAAITDDTGTITIVDDEGPSQTVTTVQAEDLAHTGATPVDSSVVEGNSLYYTVSLSNAVGTAQEYALALSGTAAAADRGSITFSDGVAWRNGDPTTGVVVVPANVASFHVTIATVDDALVESSETLILTVGGVAATGTITDNDVQTVSTVVAEDAANTGANPVDSVVVEGAALQYSVTLSSAATIACEHTLVLSGTAAGADRGSITFSDGVAWRNGDPTTGVVVVPANVSSFHITVATVDDAAIESSETVIVTVGGVASTGTINDNDVQTVSTVVAEDAAHTGANPVDSEVVEGGSLQYSVTLSAAATIACEHTLVLSGTAAGADLGSITFSDGVAWRNGDPTTGVIVVPANVASFHVTVATVDDAAIESSETVIVTVGGVASTGTITDNDVQTVSTVVAEDAAHTGANPVDSSVVEGSSLQYSVTLSTASASASEYALALSGTAAGADLGSITFSDGVAWRNGDPTTGVVVVPANVSSFHITVATVDDALIESSETVIVTVGGVASTGTINDNDVQTVSSVTAAANVMEGATLNYTVALNAASAVATEYSLSLGGTVNGGDYQSLVFSNGVAWRNGDPGTGTIVVPANVTSFVVGVVTIDDPWVEPTKAAVLHVGGASGTGYLYSDDEPAPAPTPAPAPVPVPAPVPAPTPVPVPAPAEYHAVLDPTTDDGKSNSDAVTGVVSPEFTLSSAGYFATGGSARLTTLDGTVIASQVLTAETVKAGQLNLATPVLDDGVYTFMSQVLDAQGKVVAQAPVKVTIVTDVDGVAPSVELAANGGDFNHDGIPDWQQHAVAQLPLATLTDYALGKNAPQSSFGAILAGTPDASNPAGAVKLSASAQLLDLSVSAAPAALAANTVAATPMFNFSLKAQDGEQLGDLSAAIPGLQSRVVIDLAPGGVQANDFLKWDKVNQRWYSFLDDGRLDTMDNGATLLDLNGDGKVDRIVVTLTDGGWGDEDGIANGVIVDPGMLVEHVRVATPVFSVLLGNGDRCYTTSAKEAATLALGKGNVLEGARFDALETALGGHQLNAFYQPYTKDWYYAASGDSMPYACYQAAAGAGFSAAAAGSGVGVDIHLYQNTQGQTQLLSATDAQKLGLTSHGFRDLGAKFSTTTDSAFTFDVEGYLVANRDNTAVQTLVKSLASGYHSTSDAGFIEAVEQHYLTQVALVGIAHGGLATAADVNSVFGTSFGA